MLSPKTHHLIRCCTICKWKKLNLTRLSALKNMCKVHPLKVGDRLRRTNFANFSTRSCGFIRNDDKEHRLRPMAIYNINVEQPMQ